ncbi:MAG: hypothetical protein JOY61_17355 [Chloroflexi bacterium]|nr:hypothetical protein [Chloroflexota bacterium]
MVVLLVGVLLIGVLPSAEAQTGSSASDAIPVGTDGHFSGTDQPSSSLWFKFNYIGQGQQSTVTVTFEPPDSTRLDFFLFGGDPSNPTQLTSTSNIKDNVRTVSYTAAGNDPRVIFIKVENDHPDRSVSFVGTVTPTSTIATPTPTPASATITPQTTPTAGPVAANPASAITLASNNGEFSGTLSNGQAVWYRFYYGNPGANATISISIAPSADNADLNVYTGTDPSNLSQQGGNQARSSNTISRTVSNLATAQFVYFSLGNNSGSPMAYGGSVSPFFTPPATPTVATTATAGTTTPTASPTVTVQPAPTLTHDAQYYSQTGFRVDDQMVNFFQTRGAVDTFGYPISRVFTFLGCPVQMYQRLIIQMCGGSAPAVINMLDPEIFPYTRINGSVFPGPDEALKQQTPPVSSATYSADIIPFIQTNTPDQYQGQPVNFWQTWQARGGLEILGTPISHPQVDSSNSNFIYMRFQRVILHYRAGIGTEPLLLADYLKQVILGPGAPNLPPDLQQQASGSRFYQQYCRGQRLWLCRPNDLSGTDLTYAFEQG